MVGNAGPCPGPKRAGPRLLRPTFALGVCSHAPMCGICIALSKTWNTPPGTAGGICKLIGNVVSTGP